MSDRNEIIEECARAVEREMYAAVDAADGSDESTYNLALMDAAKVIRALKGVPEHVADG